MKEVEQIIKVIYQLKWSQDPKASVHDSKLIFFFWNKVDISSPILRFPKMLASEHLWLFKKHFQHKQYELVWLCVFQVTAQRQPVF